jgi:RNA polymerase sigma-70 factor (ECF subfamily)
MASEFDPVIAVTTRFPSTHWSLIVRAGTLGSSAHRAALTELCSLYWYPLYAFIRSKGNDPQLALDLTQGYFERLLEKDVIARADRSKGRFRAFLRADCQHFLINQHRRRTARPDLISGVSIDGSYAENRYCFEPVDRLTPDRLFDRAWATTLLERVLDVLALEQAAKGLSHVFERLKEVLAKGQYTVPVSILASQLGMTVGAVHTAVHRLRKRYREILQEQISATLDDPSEMDDEIRWLFDAFRSESSKPL